ncbi:hypothetical protein [Tropicimonas isoalkanivorans]|uniref:Uncharacterized protein n=1 Tax=Tropicimonas isoalkanivorans TaxID=441112 RepID=A0A1I1EAW0_9RHOB|nr:hypothetical protein [Tropicimonas isoalkanivorans]SFB82498.1 hypothetical protein SAMN04488094_101656 [Tropicimonas isoalkanivorans]
MTSDLTRDPNPRIYNVAMCLPPAKLKGDAVLLATFSVGMWPVHVDDLQLVRYKGEVRLWWNHKGMRILSDAKPIIIEAAKEKVREALADLEDLDE